MRILAVDPGERRIGLAVSDEFRITAQGLETFDRKSGGSFMRHLSELVKRYDVREVVVGFPLSLSGEKGEAGMRAEGLASRISASFPVRVTLWDERLTTREAQSVLKGKRRRKGAADRLSAVIILQSYLDFLRSGRP